MLLELLDLAPLTFDLPLLRRDLRLRPLLRFFVVLQTSADRVAADTTDASPDQSSGDRMANGRSDNRSATSAEYRTDAS